MMAKAAARIRKLPALLAAAMVFVAAPAYAAEDFYCQDGHAQGSVYDSGMTCPTTISSDNIFSFIVCNMEQLTSDLMGSMYCGMVEELQPMVLAVLTLAVVFFGMGFTIGIIPATAREFQKFMLKVAFVTVFATQSEYMIDVVYRFLVGGAREGIAISLSGMFKDNPDYASGNVSGMDVYYQLDHFLGKALKFATDYVGADPNQNQNVCQNAVFAVMAVMAVAFPPLFYAGLLIIVGVAMTFLRALFGYVYAIVGIAFLITLSPIFLSFSLFQQTRPFFDKWVGYLVSFALQMVLVFAFLAFIVSIDVKHITGSLVNIIVPKQESFETSAMRFPWEYCTLCDFEVINNETSAVIPDDQYADFIGKGELRCKQPVKALSMMETAAPQNGNAPDEKVTNALMRLTAGGLLSLLVLAYVVNALLGMIPMLAQYLASALGVAYAPQLGGGTNIRGIVTVDMPGDGMIKTFERGFDKGFTNASGGDSLSATVQGVKSGFAQMVSGAEAADPRATDAEREQDPGLLGSFMRFLVNPHGDQHD
jgi:hypothetical protein